MDVVTYALAKGYTDKAIASVNPDAYLGVTTTALSDGSTTNPITINGNSVTAKSGQIAAYNDEEFIFDGTTWRKFGGSLAGLTDVNISSPSDGQIQRYNGTSGKWENSNETTYSAGTNVSISEQGEISATDTTYSSQSAQQGGTDVSLCTTGEKYTWGNKQDKPTILTATLAAGSTSVTFTNAAITNTARYDVYTDPYVPYEDLTRSGTTFTATFEEQTGAVSVELVINED